MTASASESDENRENERLQPIDSGNLVPTGPFKQAVAFVDEIIDQGEGLYLLTGVAGIGKTAVLTWCRDRAKDRAIVVLHKLRRVDGDNLSALLNEIFGVEQAESRGSRAQALRYFLKLGTLRAKGKRFVLVLEDVEEIHSSGAELIQALLQMKAQQSVLVNIILSGNLRLDALLDRSYRWGIQKLIRDSHQMTAPDTDQAQGLIDRIAALRGGSPLPFRRRARRHLVRLTGGVPGPLLSLGQRALNIARRTGAKAVSARMVQGAASGNYRSGTTIAYSGLSRFALAIVILLLIPVALLQQGLSPTGYSEVPIGGDAELSLVNEAANIRQTAGEQTAITPEQPPVDNIQNDAPRTTATPTSPESISSAALPVPLNQEDEIGVIDRGPAPVPQQQVAPMHIPPAISPEFNLLVPALSDLITSLNYNAGNQKPDFQKRNLTVPSWQEILTRNFAKFNREIPANQISF